VIGDAVARFGWLAANDVLPACEHVAFGGATTGTSLFACLSHPLSGVGCAACVAEHHDAEARGRCDRCGVALEHEWWTALTSVECPTIRLAPPGVPGVCTALEGVTVWLPVVVCDACYVDADRGWRVTA
jgi:hypothetical protein